MLWFDHPCICRWSVFRGFILVTILRFYSSNTLLCLLFVCSFLPYGNALPWYGMTKLSLLLSPFYRGWQLASGLQLAFHRVVCFILLTLVPPSLWKLNFELYTTNCAKMICPWLEDLLQLTWENLLRLLKLPTSKLRSCLYLRIWHRMVCPHGYLGFDLKLYYFMLVVYRQCCSFLIGLKYELDSYHLCIQIRILFDYWLLRVVHLWGNCWNLKTVSPIFFLSLSIFHR